MMETKEILMRGFIVLATSAFAICVAILAMYAVSETIEHFTPKPTADQLYGCTVKQQAPNGECK